MGYCMNKVTTITTTTFCGTDSIPTIRVSINDSGMRGPPHPAYLNRILRCDRFDYGNNNWRNRLPLFNSVYAIAYFDIKTTIYGIATVKDPSHNP